MSRLLLLILLLLPVLPAALAADPPLAMTHDLKITLDLAAQRLAGSDRIGITGDGLPKELAFWLRSDAGRTSVQLNERPVPFRLNAGQLIINPGTAWRPGTNTLQIDYAARFADPAPERPANNDNPGYGVSGTIAAQGAFLLAGAGWYPYAPEAKTTLTLTVSAPEGVLAVTSGRCLGHATQQHTTVSRWQVEQPIQGLSLAAGRYQVQRQTLGDVQLATYFTEANADLASAYLSATSEHLQAYGRLFGPYPFPGFAVVENFFPSGYGFPGYTLVGGRLLRLPFMLEASLAHEIAHSWWGSGVWVDASQGNWCEGLATYVADYRLSEARGAAPAADYRLQILRGYAALSADTADFPLTDFRSREDPLTQSVGYGKAAMVFHMLRRLIGEGPFWGGLRDLYAQKRFQHASWSDLRVAFERSSGQALQPFWEAWVARSGAARLTLSDVQRHRLPSGAWHVSGIVRQQGLPREFRLPLLLQTLAGEARDSLHITGANTRLAIECAQEPRTLTLDPDSEVFRQLAPGEIPPTINALKASRNLLVVLCEPGDARLPEAAALLLEGLGLERAEVRREAELNPADLASRDLLFVGQPQRPDVLPPLPPGLRVGKQGFSLDGVRYDQPQDVLFALLPQGDAKGRVTALLLAGDMRLAGEASRKLTHYGRYSYLAFRQGQNQAKGTWPPTESPLTHRWPQAESTPGKEP